MDNMPTMNQVHYDKYLTNISIGYKNEAFIGDQIFLTVPVDKNSDKYYVFGKEGMQVTKDDRAPGTESKEVTWEFSDDQYYTTGHALSTFVTDEERENADEGLIQELEANATELITEKILLNKEIDAASKLTDTTLLDTDMYKDIVAKWSDYGKTEGEYNSNPQMDIEEGKAAMHAKSGLYPNTLILSKPVFDKLKFHPALIALLGSSALKMLTLDMLENTFGVKILIGNALKDTAGTSSYVWGTAAVLCYVAPKAVGKKTRTTALGFRWKAKGIGGVGVRKWYETAKQATKVEAEIWYDQKIISKNSSFIFVDPIVVS